MDRRKAKKHEAREVASNNQLPPYLASLLRQRPSQEPKAQVSYDAGFNHVGEAVCSEVQARGLSWPFFELGYEDGRSGRPRLLIGLGRASIQIGRGPGAGLVFLGARAAMWRLYEGLERHKEADVTFQTDKRL